MLNIELEDEIFDIISSMNDTDKRNNTTFPTHTFAKYQLMKEDLARIITWTIIYKNGQLINQKCHLLSWREYKSILSPISTKVRNPGVRVSTKYLLIKMFLVVLESVHTKFILSNFFFEGHNLVFQFFCFSA